MDRRRAVARPSRRPPPEDRPVSGEGPAAGQRSARRILPAPIAAIGRSAGTRRGAGRIVRRRPNRIRGRGRRCRAGPRRSRGRREPGTAAARGAVAPHLHVSAARGGGLDLDDHLPFRLWNLLHPQVERSVEDRRPQGTTTTLSASPRRWSSSASRVRSRGRRCVTSDSASISPEVISSSAARISPGPAE